MGVKKVKRDYAVKKTVKDSSFVPIKSGLWRKEKTLAFYN
jgi:hypothetical protein